MSSLYFSERITGLANTTVFGNGITSTEVEPKKLKSVIIVVSARQGNLIEGWIERERVLLVIDAILNLATESFRLQIPINTEIPIGKDWKMALRCGATASIIDVLYEYELI